MTSQISGTCFDSDIEPDQYKSFVWESHVRQHIFVDFFRFLSSKETKSSLVSITYILKIINVRQDNVKHGKKCTDELFYFLCGVITVGKIKLRHVWRAWDLVKFIGKGCSIFFFECLCYATLIVLQGIRYCMVPT